MSDNENTKRSALDLARKYEKVTLEHMGGRTVTTDAKELSSVLDAVTIYMAALLVSNFQDEEFEKAMDILEEGVRHHAQRLREAMEGAESA